MNLYPILADACVGFVLGNAALLAVLSFWKAAGDRVLSRLAVALFAFLISPLVVPIAISKSMRGE